MLPEMGEMTAANETVSMMNIFSFSGRIQYGGPDISLSLVAAVGAAEDVPVISIAFVCRSTVSSVLLSPCWVDLAVSVASIAVVSSFNRVLQSIPFVPSMPSIPLQWLPALLSLLAEFISMLGDTFIMFILCILISGGSIT